MLRDTYEFNLTNSITGISIFVVAMFLVFQIGTPPVPSVSALWSGLIAVLVMAAIIGYLCVSSDKKAKTQYAL